MTLRTGGWRENEELPVGTIVPADITRKWPLANRIALEGAAYVRFFVSPDEAVHGTEIREEVRADPIRARIKTKDATAVRRTTTRYENAKRIGATA